ncbi:AMP-binding protein, partial [Streptomyces sp. ISL-11]|uniref:AMP-binding protein n=1 Tax=Streptomyces sp. ISL-11 TaxID=2819174 RepID=UPI001BECD190
AKSRTDTPHMTTPTLTTPPAPARVPAGVRARSPRPTPPPPPAPVPAPVPVSVHAVIAAQAAERPHHTAVRAHDGALTYTALDEQANHLAHRLRAQGVTPGDTVAVCLEPSARQITALLAVLKAGAAYLALDPAHPGPTRPSTLLHHTGAKAVITQELFAAPLRPHPGLLLLDAHPTHKAPRSPRPPEVHVPAHAPAYLLPMAGPSRKPWAVCVPHKALTALTEDARFLPVHPSDTALSCAPAHTPGSALGVWAPLMKGARLLLAPTGLTPAELTALMAEEHTTLARLSLRTFTALATTGLRTLRTLRTLVLTQAPLSADQLQLLRRELPITELIQTTTL